MVFTKELVNFSELKHALIEGLSSNPSEIKLVMTDKYNGIFKVISSEGEKVFIEAVYKGYDPMLEMHEFHTYYLDSRSCQWRPLRPKKEV